MFDTSILFLTATPSLSRRLGAGVAGAWLAFHVTSDILCLTPTPFSFQWGIVFLSWTFFCSRNLRVEEGL